MPLKVLVVDDDVPTLELITEVLSGLGVKVHPLSDSQQAASLINREKFDGIFLDLMMPQVDGFELAQAIRRSSWNRRTPIIIVTGREEKDAITEAFQAGGTFFLRKPVDKAKLTALLNRTRGAMLEERRRFQRVSVRMEVSCRRDARKVIGTSSNVSQEGILFQGDGSLEPGNELRLSFCLPGQKLPIELEGLVVRLDEKQRVGVRFTEVSAEDRQRLRDFVASQE